MRKLVGTLFLMLFLVGTMARAQVKLSGLADFVFKNGSAGDHFNDGWKGSSNYHTMRARVFLDAPLSDDDGLFMQVLFDQYYFNIYGVYARFSNLAGKYLNLNVGLIPLTVGSFGARTYSDKNPLIGTPLLYNYHSNYSPGGPDSIHSVAELLDDRSERYSTGLPVIFDAYWNTGAELFGSAGKLDYSLGLLTGSVSRPTYEQYKDMPQFTTHFAYYFGPGLVVGASAFYGPYLAKELFGDSIPRGRAYSSYTNGGIGYEFYGVYRYLEINSESYYAYWQHPYLPTLKVTSGYLESKFKFTPGWYVAGRFDFFEPLKVPTETGAHERWDYPVHRFEIGLGFHPTRQALLKLVGQFNRVSQEEELNDDLYALQLSISF